MAAHAHSPATLNQLRCRWLSFAALAGALVVAGGWLLAAQQGQAYALNWAALAAAVLLYQLLFHVRDLNLNHRPGENQLLPSLGPGTWLSLLRLLCIGLLAGFLFQSRPIGWLAWAPFFINLLANATDFFDGYAARLSGQVTELGRKLDLDLDGRGLLVVSLLAVQYGAVPAWFLLVGLARYLFLFGLWLRQRRGLPVHELAPRRGRRALAGAQMGLTTALLAPILGPPETMLAAALFTIPFLFFFLLDWLQVNGGLPAYFSTPDWRRVQLLISRWPPLALRGLAALLMLQRISVPSHPVFTILDWAMLLAVVLGAAARLASVVGLIATGFHLHFFPGLPADLYLVVVLSLLLYLGSGALAWWTPEETWISRRPAEREQ